MLKPRVLFEQDHKEIKRLCKTGLYSSKKIAEMIGKPYGAVINYMTNHNVINECRHRQKRKFNKRFFSSLGLLQCYYAGLFLADAAIYEHHGRMALEWSISTEDIEYMKMFLRNINTEERIRIRTVPCTLNKDKITYSEMCSVYFHCREFAEDLDYNYKMNDNKLRRFPPPSLPTLKHRLAFFAGMIDGDGSIHLGVNDTMTTVSIGSCNRDSIVWCKNLIDSLKLPKICKGFDSGISIHPKGTCYYYRFSGLRAYIFIELVTRLNLPLFQRKWFHPSVVELMNKYKQSENWPPESFFTSLLNHDIYQDSLLHLPRNDDLELNVPKDDIIPDLSPNQTAYQTDF